MSKPKSPTDKRVETCLADATLHLLERAGWNELTLGAVVRSANLSWADVFSAVSSKSALLGAILRRTVEDTARAYRPEGSSISARERVFDVCMTWFDVHQKRKGPFHALYSALRADPLILMAERGAIHETAERLLALSEADASSLAPARAILFSGILVRATLAWLEDDDDLSRTMARLDSDLRRTETLLWPKSARTRDGTKKNRQRVKTPKTGKRRK